MWIILKNFLCIKSAEFWRKTMAYSIFDFKCNLRPYSKCVLTCWNNICFKNFEFVVKHELFLTSLARITLTSFCNLQNILGSYQQNQQLDKSFILITTFFLFSYFGFHVERNSSFFGKFDQACLEWFFIVISISILALEKGQ